MKLILIKTLSLILALMILSGCATFKGDTEKLSDKDYENLMIGSWYMPRPKEHGRTATGISSYTEDHNISYIAFSDLNCTTPTLTSLGNWKVIDGHLIIIVTESSQHIYLTPGDVITDKIISADHENMILQSVNDEEHYSRTKINTCNQ